MEHAFGVVMAGGSGERFWPLSRQHNPKQLLCLTNVKRNMLEEALDRLLPIIPPERIWIATSELLKDKIQESIRAIPKENIIGEPHRRNTSGCIAYAAAHALHRIGEEALDMVMAVTTADHQISPTENFVQTLRSSMRHASQREALMTIGIPPTRPETGYGYIEIPDGANAVDSIDGIDIFPVAQFREKPHAELAKEYAATGRHYWNSGMFSWKLSSFMTILDRVNPALSNAIREMSAAMKSKDSGDEAIRAIFKRLPNLSIDYALMEKAQGSVFVTKANYKWDDVGSWEAITRNHPSDEKGNVSIGDPVLIDCHNVTVYNAPGAEQMALGVIGMRDVCVIATDDGLLVCPKDRVQDVRDVVARLKETQPKFT